MTEVKRDDVSGLTKLGSQRTTYGYTSPDIGMLETFPNAYPGSSYVVRHATSEFTSLCPKTGQPDFAKVQIEYVPRELCVESKSLKLYLFAYRGEGSFMETICNRIAQDLITLLNPVSLEARMEFNARGGIQTTVRAGVLSEV